MTNAVDADPYRNRADELGELLKTDPSRAFPELLRLAADSASCELLLGWAYDKGLGTPSNAQRAEACFIQAASKGADMGYFYLGDHYLGEEKYAEARSAFRTGAAMGDEASRTALLELEQGLEAERAFERLESDPDGAFATLNRLAKDGSPNSMLYLGWAYQNGLGTPADSEIAANWFQRAYDFGVQEAADYLGHSLYYDGYQCLGTKPTNYIDAFDHFSKAVKLGYAPAMLKLAEFYAKGLGVTKQPKEARHLYEKAAERGNLWGRRELAKQYIRGRYGLTRIWQGVQMYIDAIKEMYSVAKNDRSDIRLLK